MIEYVKGDLAEITPAYAVVDCNGVGYFLNISLNTFAKLQNEKQAKLFVHESIREDAYVLFGFAEKQERELFALLISVSGVGPNTARMILSSFSVADLQSVIATGNVNLLKAVKGIGAKTAQRIIVDLKDNVLLKYIYYQLLNMNLHQYAKGGGQPLITAGQIKELKIPLPSLEEQQRIVDILDRFDTICNDLTSGLPAEIEARQKQYEYYRDKLLQFRIKNA